jgi:hypothetical protein
MPGAGIDAATMIRVLQGHDVQFVVVGGFAVELWDVAVRPTVDVDITPEASHRNLGRLAKALSQLGARIRVGDETVEVPGGLTAANIEGMSVLNLWTEAGPLDITMIPAGTGGYAELAERAAEIPFEGVVVPTASLEDVARSKEAAGRAKDMIVLPAIMAHLRRMRAGG